MEISVEEIQKKFAELPEDLKWAIMAAKIDDHIVEIGKKNSLNVEQMGQLSLETHMIALGIIHPDKFEASIQASMKMDTGKTRAVVNDVNEMILKNIRRELMSLHASKKPEITTKEDHGILKSAGIEIVPDEPSIPGQVADGKRDDMIKKIENPSQIQPTSANPVAEQKLSGSFSLPKTQTEHSAEKTEPVSEGSTPKVDPYREIPG